MKYYDICTDQTIDIPFEKYIWIRIKQLRHDLLRWLSLGFIVPAVQVCHVCVQKLAVRTFDMRLDWRIKKWTKLCELRLKEEQSKTRYENETFNEFYRRCYGNKQ